MIRSYSLIGCCLALVASAAAQEFEGWQTLRVIHQEGSPDRMIAAPLDADGRESLVVVNARHSRLDIYRWQPKDKRSPPLPADPLRPNELPLAPEWSHTELPLEDLPADALVRQSGGKPELLVLSATNKVLSYQRDGGQAWKKTAHWDLLPGKTTGNGPLMLLRKSGDKDELLISFEQGIQTLLLEPGSRAAWLSPRENRGRTDWKLLDLDGDGDQDLVEWTSQARQTVRWYECVDGKLLPAQVLYEHSVHGLGGLSLRSKPAELLLLGGSWEGVLRRYVMSQGDANELGRQESLPMPGGAKAAWCGIMLDGRPALVTIDISQPRLRVHELAASGWLSEQSYPTISGVRGLAAPLAKPGALLLWTKDAADLLISQWRDGRLTYPEAMSPKDKSDDRRILTLESTNSTIWWAQRVGSHLDLYVWDKTAAEPRRTRFSAQGTKVEKVVWLGGNRLLVQQAYATSAKLVVLDGEKVIVSEPPHLAKVDLAEFSVYRVGDKLRAGRLTDGVLQWLADDLHPLDQIMLPDGQRLAAYIPTSDGQAWAMEQGASFIDRLQPDKSGIPRVASRIKPPNANSMRLDPVLGLMLGDQDRVVRLSPGRPAELKLFDSIDSRVGRPSGVKEATIHRFLVSDVTGDGDDDVVLCDDQRHQLTVLVRDGQTLKSLISWQVFEDQAYPYGGDKKSLASEPRIVIGLDADGDSRRDVGMLCHDRLIIYLARELP